MRLLIVSTLNSAEPFGSFTRPFYLGKYLSDYFKVFQLGIDCSAVDYTQSKSIGVRSVFAYKREILNCVKSFQPDIIYAQETLPAIATLLSIEMALKKTIPIVFDFHTLSAFEYWTRLASSSNQLQELRQLIKTYIAQGLLILSGKPIITAGQPVSELIYKWYPGRHLQVQPVGNGVPDDLINIQGTSKPDLYSNLCPAKIVIVTAPRTFSFPTNDMSVTMTIEIAQRLEHSDPTIHFVVVGRDAENFSSPLPRNMTFAGFLPDRQDFVAYLQHADVALLPFPKQAVAGGARNKALDYFACKKLVVSTPEGMRGLEGFQNQKHLLITDYDINSIAETVKFACANLEASRSIASEAHSIIRTNYSWSAMAAKIAKILHDTYEA